MCLEPLSRANSVGNVFKRLFNRENSKHDLKMEPQKSSSIELGNTGNGVIPGGKTILPHHPKLQPGLSIADQVIEEVSSATVCTFEMKLLVVFRSMNN